LLMIISGCKGTMFFSIRQTFLFFFFLLPVFFATKQKKNKWKHKKLHFSLQVLKKFLILHRNIESIQS